MKTIKLWQHLKLEMGERGLRGLRGNTFCDYPDIILVVPAELDDMSMIPMLIRVVKQKETALHN